MIKMGKWDDVDVRKPHPTSVVLGWSGEEDDHPVTVYMDTHGDWKCAYSGDHVWPIEYWRPLPRLPKI